MLGWSSLGTDEDGKSSSNNCCFFCGIVMRLPDVWVNLKLLALAGWLCTCMDTEGCFAVQISDHLRNIQVEVNKNYNFFVLFKKRYFIQLLYRANSLLKYSWFTRLKNNRTSYRVDMKNLTTLDDTKPIMIWFSNMK